MASRIFCTKQSFTLVCSSFTARRQEIRDRLLTKWFHGQWSEIARNLKYVDCLFNFDNQKYSNFWQPEIFEFLTTWNIWIFDNLKYLNFWQPEIFECLQPECLNNGSNLNEAIKHGSVSSWKHSVHSMPLSSILKLFEILNREQILTKEQSLCWIYLRSTGWTKTYIVRFFLWHCEQVTAAFSAS